MYIVHAFIIILLEYAHKTTNNELGNGAKIFQEITLVIEWQWIS